MPLWGINTKNCSLSIVQKSLKKWYYPPSHRLNVNVANFEKSNTAENRHLKNRKIASAVLPISQCHVKFVIVKTQPSVSAIVNSSAYGGAMSGYLPECTEGIICCVSCDYSLGSVCFTFTALMPELCPLCVHDLSECSHCNPKKSYGTVKSPYLACTYMLLNMFIDSFTE